MHNNGAPVAQLQSYARKLGAGFTIIAALMSASAGYAFGGDSMFAGVLLAALLGGLTVATALMLNFIDLAWTAGQRGVAAVLSAVALCMGIAEYGSHVAFGTSHRTANIEQASIQTARYVDTRDQVEEGKASLEMWTARLKKLEGENAWATTVNAEALRNQEAAESRRGGCGPRCLEIRARIAIVEETGTLRKQIEATRAVLDQHRAKAEKTDKGDSIALNQSALYATAFTGQLTPTASAVAWANIGVGAYLALISTLLGSVFNWLGFHAFAARLTNKSDNSQPASASEPMIIAASVHDELFRKVQNAVRGSIEKTATA